MPIYATVGTISFPLQYSTSNSMSDLDLGRDLMLALMAAAINHELSPRWNNAIAGTPLADQNAPPVYTTVPAEPSPELLRTAGLLFPVLCCYRTGEPNIEALSMSTHIFRHNIVLEYIMAPWTAGSERKLGDVFRAILAIAHCVVRDKGHTAYALDPIYQSQPLAILGQGAGCANFYELAIASATFGAAAFSKDSPQYNACRIVFNAAELVEDTSAVQDVDYMGDTMAHDLGVTDDFIDNFSGAHYDFSQ